MISDFPNEHRVCIKATLGRTRTAGYYVEVNRDTAKKLKLTKWAVIAFEHPALEQNETLANRFQSYLAIHCQVRIVDGLDNKIIAVDQTLRNALGVPFEIFKSSKSFASYPFYLMPARRKFWHWIRTGSSSIFGVRYLAFRTKSADVADIEKGYVRIQTEVLKTLGVQEADDLIIERPFALVTDGLVREFEIGYTRLSVFGASDRMLDQRKSLQKDYRDRYPNAQEILYNYDCFISSESLTEGGKQERGATTLPEPDVPPVFMDYDARNSGVAQYPHNGTADYLTPLMVRRSITSAICRESIQTGMTFGIALINVTLAFTRGIDPISPSDIVFASVISAIITIALLIARLRQQV
ncbi:hypothetical protein SAMN05720354_102123 [Nitrosospira sp. Nsp1]|nr:hypothetical protein SAMN05720354_102123 [Nitrosospira sp. Nsp1]